MKLALVQFNPLIGDILGNSQRILGEYRSALDNGAQVVVFPEMALLGYPALDLLFHPSVALAVHGALDFLREQVSQPLILGSPLYVAAEGGGELAAIELSAALGEGAQGSL